MMANRKTTMMADEEILTPEQLAINWLRGCWPFRAPTGSIGEGIGEVIEKAIECIHGPSKQSHEIGEAIGRAFEPMHAKKYSHEKGLRVGANVQHKHISHDEQPPSSEICWDAHWPPGKPPPHHYMGPKVTVRTGNRRQQNAAHVAAIEAREELELATARKVAAEAARRAFERARVQPMQTKTPEPRFGLERNRQFAVSQSELQWQATTASQSGLPAAPTPGSAAWISASLGEQAKMVESSRIPHHMTAKQMVTQAEAQTARRQNQLLESVRISETKRANLKAYRDLQKRLQQERQERQEHKLQAAARLGFGTSGQTISDAPAAAPAPAPAPAAAPAHEPALADRIHSPSELSV